jgi:cytochrome oxidase Cu insertion factor (SCO1/SenC/PrrC family)
MNSGLNIDDSTVVSAFKLALLHQGILIVLVFGTLALAWVSVRELTGTNRGSFLAALRGGGDAEPEAPARRLLRISFGLLWIVDGILQAQPGMAVGLPSQVAAPAAATSPPWVQHLVNWAGTSWSYHPIQAAAATVWIQIGIGIWMLLARSGRLSRLAGVVGLGWALVVWAFGEAFGGIFAPGVSWLIGAPGSATLYAVAGALLALPDRFWRSARTGRYLLGGTGVFLIGMALLQAWPGRGFWQGDVRGQPGSLASMVQAMSVVSQPSPLAHLVSGFATFSEAHGFLINLVAVVALAALGGAFLTGRPRLVRPAMIVFAVLCAAVWVLVQDIGVFGGVGTDPNSMIPMFVVALAGYLALTPPALAAAPVPEPAVPEPVAAAADRPETPPPAAPPPAAPTRPGKSWRQRLRPATLTTQFAHARIASVAAAGAIVMIAFGVVPLAAAQASSTASPILAESIDGASAPISAPAPGFTLTDQNGQTVSLAGLRGKTVLLTFLDPVCVTDCPLIAQEFREADEMLAAQSKQVVLVAINLNPLYDNVSYLRAFDQQEHLASIANWHYLTGSPRQLAVIWRDYGVASQTLPAGAMLGHSDAAFVISSAGRLVQEMDFTPGPGTTATVSSFATELVDAAHQAMS